MYINISLLKSRNISLLELSLLQLVKQARIEDVSDVLSQNKIEVDSLVEKGYIAPIKGKKGQNIYQTLRTTKKGNEVLEDISTPEIDEDDKKVAEWLINHYKSLDKEIGNKRKLERHIRDFRTQSGIIRNNLVILCLDFLRENEERSNKLEYIWYYPKTAFATKFDLEESWLYNHYLKNKERLDSKFEVYE